MGIDSYLPSNLKFFFSSTLEENMNYKVITMKDRFFSGKFDPEKLETMLNSYAGEGWELSGVTTAEIPGALGQKREEIIFILERP
jgi:hypothetical protein